MATEPVETHRDVPEEKKRNFVDAVVSNARNFLISFAVLLVVAYVFERITSAESLAWALNGALAAQSGLTNAVASLSPLHLPGYWYDGYTFFVGLLAYLPDWLFDFIKQPAQMVCAILGLCALPVVVIREGSLFEQILIIGVYVPLFFFVRQQAVKDDTTFVTPWCLLFAFLFTMLFYWFVQLILQGTLAVFSGFIVTARLAVGGSLLISAALWAAGKQGEHTVTERVLEVVARR